MPRVVIDANVFVSIVLGGKITGKINELLIEGKFKLVYSLELFNELKYVLGRKDFEFSQSQIDRILTLIEAEGELVLPDETINVCRDPKDNPVLECAVAGKVDFIVTGDKDLLALKSFKKIPIIPPQKFLKKIQTTD
ncbi:MAG: putative toxin-antitoxin system toxin component, PIN family [Elusimicrobiota bacterium]